MFEPRTSLRKRGEKKGNCSLAGITPAVYVVKDGDEEVSRESERGLERRIVTE